MTVQTKLKKLEETFNLAKESLEEINIDEKELTVVEECDGEVCIPEVVDEDGEKIEEEIFSIKSLKTDFALTRQNLLKLINAGQNMLTQAQVLDLADMKGSQIEALATLQNTIGKNLKLLIDLYDKILNIEERKNPKNPPKQEEEKGKGGGTHIDKAVIFNGSTKELLDLMSRKEDEEKDV